MPVYLPGSSHYTTRCFLFLAVAADCCLLPVDLGTLPVDLALAAAGFKLELAVCCLLLVDLGPLLVDVALAAAGFELELEPFLVPVDLELAPGPLPVARLGLLDTTVFVFDLSACMIKKEKTSNSRVQQTTNN